MGQFTPSIAIGLLLLLAACQQPANPDGPATRHLSAFKGLPPDLEGCSCYFSGTEKEFTKERYLFAADLDSTAFIALNGTLIRLRLVSSTREPHTTDEREYQETYSDGVHKVIVNIRFKEHTGDEVWWNTGSIQIFFKDVPVETRSFVGECGC